jgi:YVTN family beta-propeller protein
VTVTVLVRSTTILAVLVILWASAAPAIWQSGEVDLGQPATALVMDPLTRDLFVTTGTSTILRIDEPTQGVSSIVLADPAGALAVDPARRLLVATQAIGGTVTFYNIDTGDTSIVMTGGSPGAVAVDPVRGLASICDPGSDRIVVTDGASVTRTFALVGTPAAVAVDPLTGHGFASITDAGLIFEFDAAGTDTSYHAAGAQPGAVEMNPERGEVYVANTAGASVTVLSIDTGTTATVSLTENPVALTANPETGILYCCGGSAVEMVVLATHAVLKVILPGQPQAIAVDALSDRAFASMPAAGKIAEIAPGGGTLVLDVAGTPSACLFNPITNKFYVANPGTQSVDIFEAANYSGTTIAASGGPGPVALNLRNHKVYVPRYYSARTTVIDGYTDTATQFAVADGPNGVHVDPVTGDVFVVCAWSGVLAVKRAGSPDTLLAPLHAYPHGIEYNPNTGKIYVSNRSSADLSVIDAATLDTVLVRTGNYPCFTALNQEDNRIYTTNRTSWSLTVVDGATLSTAFARIGPGPTQVRVNPFTNKMVTADSNDRTLSVVDGVTLERTVLPAGSTPRAVAFNTITNTIYASSGLDGEILVIDGDTYERTPVNGDIGLFEVSVDPYLDKAYCVSWDNNSVTVVDGVSRTSHIVPVGYEPHGSVYDPVLEKLYVSNHAGNSISVIKLRQKISPRIAVAIDSLAGHVTYSSTPTFTGTATSLRTPRNFGIMKVLYKIDNLRGDWSEASLVGSGSIVQWQINAPALNLGRHALFVTAIDSTAGSISSSSASGLLRVSDFECYNFVRLTPPPGAPEHVVVERMPDDGGLSLAWDNTCGDGGWYDIEVSSDPSFSEGVLRFTGITGTDYVFSPESFVGEDDYCRVVAVDYPHGKRSLFSEGFLLRPAGSAGGDGEPASPLTLLVYPNPSPGNVNVRLLGAGDGEITCSVFDVTGRLVADLPVFSSGDRATASWESAPGIYYARVKTPTATITHKIIIIR